MATTIKGSFAFKSWPRFTLTFILCFVIVLVRLQGQALEILPVSLIDKSSGLSLTDNRFIYTDTKGFTWISSVHGLHRFDGKNIRLYLPDDKDSTSINGLIVNGHLSEDREGNIWFCTYGAINCYVRAKDSFTSFTYPGSQSPDYFSCGMDIAGNLWLMHDNTLMTFNVQQHTFNLKTTVKPSSTRGQFFQSTNGDVPFAITYNNDRSNPGFQVTDFRNGNKPLNKTYFSSDSKMPIVIRDLHIENDSIFWIASRTGLYSFNLNQEDIQFYSPFPEKEFMHFNGLEKINDSLLLIVSYGQGVFTFNLNQLRFENQYKIVYQGQEILEPPQAVYKDDNGGIWISIIGAGVAYYHPQNLFFQFYKHVVATTLSTSGINLNSLIELPDKRIWASSNLHGAVLMSDAKTILNHLERDKTKGLSANNTEMSFKDSDGKIWLLTASGPVVRHQDNTLMPILPDRIANFPSGCEVRKGEIILGSYAGGLYRTTDDDKMRIHLKRIEEVDSSKVYTLLYQHSDSLIYGAADYASLDIYAPGHSFHMIKSIPFHVIVQCMVPMNHGSEIWIGTNKGIFIYRQTPGTLDQEEWMEDLNDLIVYGIVLSENNSIWLSTNQGIYRLNTDKKTIESFSIQNGTGAIDFNPNSFLRRSNGEIWFGSLDGITVIDPSIKMTDVPLGKINFTNLLINDEPAEWLKCELTGATNTSELMKIKLPYRENTLRLEFTALDYAGPYHSQFLYRLVGVDENWIESNSVGSARYANLKHGEYKFVVKAKNVKPGQLPALRELIIDIKAPLHQKSWFVQLALLVIFSLIVLSIRMYAKRKQKFQQLEFEKRIALETERLRIANDMHDDLGSGLSALSLKAKLMAEQPVKPELQSQLQEFANTANRLTQSIRETIWTINSKNDTIDNLVTHLHQYAVEYFNGTGVECHVEIMQEQILTSIPGSHRREIYLAFKEALHNIQKHAATSSVKISILRQIGNQLVIRIQDYGHGFDSNVPSKGIGLASMEKHMHNIGGQFQILADTTGTRVTLSYAI